MTTQERKNKWAKDHMKTVSGHLLSGEWTYLDPDGTDVVTVLPEDFLTCPKGQRYHFCHRYPGKRLFVPVAMFRCRMKCQVRTEDFASIMYGRKSPSRLSRIK